VSCQHNSLTGCSDCNARAIERENARLREELARYRAALEWYATVPRDDDGATMPLDRGERARAALEKEKT